MTPFVEVPEWGRGQRGSLCVIGHTITSPAPPCSFWLISRPPLFALAASALPAPSLCRWQVQKGSYERRASPLSCQGNSTLHVFHHTFIRQWAEKGQWENPSRSCLGCTHPSKETDWQGCVTPPTVTEVSSLGRSSAWLSVHFTPTLCPCLPISNEIRSQ